VDTTTLTVRREEEARRWLVAALAAMVDDGCFTGHEDTVGMEIELDVVRPARPAPAGQRRGARPARARALRPRLPVEQLSADPLELEADGRLSAVQVLPRQTRHLTPA
jgi:hypothetical protein